MVFGDDGKSEQVNSGEVTGKLLLPLGFPEFFEDVAADDGFIWEGVTGYVFGFDPEVGLPFAVFQNVESSIVPLFDHFGAVDLVLVEEVGHFFSESHTFEFLIGATILKVGGYGGEAIGKAFFAQQHKEQPGEVLGGEHVWIATAQYGVEVIDEFVGLHEAAVGGDAQVAGQLQFQPVVHALGLGDDEVGLKDAVGGGLEVAGQLFR